jgi:hypothetical protein
MFLYLVCILRAHKIILNPCLSQLLCSIRWCMWRTHYRLARKKKHQKILFCFRSLLYWRSCSLMGRCLKSSWWKKSRNRRSPWNTLLAMCWRNHHSLDRSIIRNYETFPCSFLRCIQLCLLRSRRWIKKCWENGFQWLVRSCRKFHFNY